MEFIDKKEFARVTIDKNVKPFVVHITSLSLSLMLIYTTKKAQIGSFIIKKVNFLKEYSNFSNVFLKEKDLVLSKITNLNQDTIKLQKGQ